MDGLGIQSTRQALMDGLLPACKQLHATLPKERQLIALSNEYIVYVSMGLYNYNST